MFILVMIVAMVVSIAAFTGLNFMTHFYDWVNILGAVALGTGVFLALKPENKKKLELHLDGGNELSQENFDKAVDDYNYISDSLKYVKDMQLRVQINTMQKTAANILRYLKKHPEKVSVARRFIDYYQDSTVNLLEKYIELEHTQLQTDNVQAIKERTKSALTDLNKAYTEQFEKIINDQIMDMDAELKVMEQAMKADGHHDDNSQVHQENTQRVRKDFSQDPMYNKAPDKFSRFSNLPKWGKFDINKITNSDDSAIIKRKLIAGGLGIFFGGFGAHKFYLGKTGWGVAYLLFSWTGIPFIIGFIEGVRYIFMSCDEFFEKFYLK